jgi:hypothetical protein
MAYDRYDPEERRWREEEDRQRMARGRDERGFFERAGDEVRSWFGDEGDRPDRYRETRADRDRNDDPWRWRDFSSSERDYNPRYQDELDRGYRPMAGDYARSGSDEGRGTEWDRDSYRRTTFAGSRARSNHDDLHYEDWRRRQMEDLDRDYDEYRRERQSKFEEDFGGWRERRQSKRQMLGDIREHMEVVGSDNEHVGTVDRVAGDRIILTRSDPQSGGVHHSLSCADLDRVEGDRVVLECSAEKARERWRDENRSRALFEREDQGRAGPRILDRSFRGTYR